MIYPIKPFMNHATGFCFWCGRCLPEIIFALAFSFTPLLSAAVIGTNTPAPALSRERIATLPKAQQAVWKKYLKRSERQRQADQNFLRREMREHGVKTPLIPPSSSSARSIPLNEPTSWYGSNEAVRIANIIVSFQTPAGGWSKNLNLAKQARVPGESFAPDNNSRHLSKDDFDSLPAGHWDYVGTFDNNATITELRFLAKVIAAGRPNQVKRLSRIISARSGLHVCRPISQRRLAAGLAAARRLSRCHHLQRRRDD